jgi:beta-1,4-mannosyl-glycoprotein beta-1,4-N-acetylglucosaminyltransferase
METNKKIIDCFLFFNEIELLIYRINILYEYVDYFIICESKYTFSGKLKKLYFNDYKNNNDSIGFINRYKSKIIHVILEELPYIYPNIDYDKKQQWVNESFQRNYINKVLDSMELNDEDFIINCDIDEIPNPSIISQLKKLNLPNNGYNLSMDMYHYNLTIKNTEKWKSAKLLKYSTCKCNSTNDLIIEYNESSNHIIYNDKDNNNDYNEIKTEDDIYNLNYLRGINFTETLLNWGWHLCYFYDDIKLIQNKIDSFSHQEFNNSFINNYFKLKDKIEKGKDIFNRKYIHLQKIELNDNNNLPFDYNKYLLFTNA